MALLLASCRTEGVADPHGPVASAEHLLLINATEIMLVVVLPVIVLTLAFAWWYRAGNARAAFRPDFVYSGQVELVVWSIPAMIVILLAGVAWIGAHRLDPRAALAASAPPLRIQAVSLDWKWLFIYPDQAIASVNDLTVPAGVPLQFEITSATVMNAFFVPELGGMIYAMPGMTTHLNLLAAQPGDYAGFSAHYSGDGFSDMHFVVHAMPAAAFQAWEAGAAAAGPSLDYARVAQRGVALPSRWRGVAPGLFATILRQSAPDRAPRG